MEQQIQVQSFHENFNSFLKKLGKKTHRKVRSLMVHCTTAAPFRRRGYLPIYVGEERRKYVIPIESLSSTMMQALLNQFQDQIDRTGEAITLPCSVMMFEAVLRLSI